MGLIDKMRNMSYEELCAMDLESLSDGMLKVRLAFLQVRTAERDMQKAFSQEEKEESRRWLEKRLAVAEKFAEYYAGEEN